MDRRRAAVAGLAGLLALLGADRGDDAPDALPPEALVLLDKADTIELISIDPLQHTATPAESFHGWKVLGRTSVRDPESRRAIVSAVKKGVAEAGDGAGCFEPRHGLRATRGASRLELVICFSCRWIEVHGAGKTSSVRTSGSAKAAMNAALRAAGVPLAQDVEGP